MKCRADLESVINNAGLPSRSLRSFNEVTVKCQGVLEKIMSSMSKPFLAQAAQQVREKVEAANAFASTLQLLPAKAIQTSGQKLPAKRDDVPQCDKTCVVRVEQLAEKDKWRSDVAKYQTKQRVQPTATDSVSENTALRAGPSVSTADEESKADSSSEGEISNESDTDFFESYDYIWCPKGKGVKRPGSGPKKPWSAHEEEMVYKGVKRYGVGNWAMIRENFLPYRSNIGIKDKWRTMTKQGRLPDMAFLFGPL